MRDPHSVRGSLKRVPAAVSLIKNQWRVLFVCKPQFGNFESENVGVIHPKRYTSIKFAAKHESLCIVPVLINPELVVVAKFDRPKYPAKVVLIQRECENGGQVRNSTKAPSNQKVLLVRVQVHASEATVEICDFPVLSDKHLMANLKSFLRLIFEIRNFEEA